MTRTTLAAIVGLGFAGLASAASAQLAITWYTIDGGGGTSTGGTFSLSGTIGQPDASTTAHTGGTFSLAGGYWPGAASGVACPSDYNRDGFHNLDDLGDYITDFYTTPAIPGGPQPAAPTYPGVAVGFSVPCPAAADADPPYVLAAYRQRGFRVGYSPDGSNSCPLDPAQLFPNLDNLNDFITAYYAEVGTPACGG
jgi:hypothetical protein